MRHRGAWALRAALVAALVAGLLAGVSTPAHAQPDVQLGNIGNIEVDAGGGNQNVQLQVENRGQGNDGVARDVQLTMTVPGGIGAVIASAPNGCSLSANNTRMDCNLGDLQPGGDFNGVAQVGAAGNAPVEAGDSRTEAAQVVLSTGASESFNVKVNGPDEAPTVPEVSGTVTEQDTGDPVDGAQVTLVDSQGTNFTTTTNAQGQFTFSGEEIAPGRVAMSASKDGYESGGEATEEALADQPLSGIQLALVNTETPSPTPEASESASPAPTETASPVPVADSGSGGSFFTTLMIVLGVLLVALGIGAIVLLVIRHRRRLREEEEGDEGPAGAGGPPSGPQGPRPTPGSHGVYRPTPTQAAGAGQTQVIGPGGPVPAVGPRTALANSPGPTQGDAGETAMIPRAGDPPGPRPPVPGGPPPPGGHGAAPPTATHPAVAQPGTYGGGEYGRRGGYGEPGEPGGADDRGYGGYDQPAGRHGRGGGYEPEQPHRGDSYGPDPYAQPASPAGRPYSPRGREPGYAGPGQHGHQGYDGYGDQGHGDHGYRDQGYGSYGDHGYEDRSGYDRRGYDRGYGDQGYGDQGYGDQGYGERGYDHRGYDDQGYRDRGYDDRGYGRAPEPPAPDPGYYPDERSRRPAPPERRRLDWLDD